MNNQTTQTPTQPQCIHPICIHKKAKHIKPGTPAQNHHKCTQCENFDKTIRPTWQIERHLINQPTLRKIFTKYTRTNTHTQTQNITINRTLQLLKTSTTIMQIITKNNIQVPTIILPNRSQHTKMAMIIRNIVHTLQLQTTITDPLQGMAETNKTNKEQNNNTSTRDCKDTIQKALKHNPTVCTQCNQLAISRKYRTNEATQQSQSCHTCQTKYNHNTKTPCPNCCLYILIIQNNIKHRWEQATQKQTKTQSTSPAIHLPPLPKHIRTHTSQILTTTTDKQIKANNAHFAQKNSHKQAHWHTTTGNVLTQTSKM